MVSQIARLARGRDWQIEKIVLTALVAALLVGTALLLGWPLWVIALLALVPWLPLFLGNIVWSSRHYGFMALFLAFVVLQLGHFGEHIAQLVQFATIDDPAQGCVGWSWNGPGCGAAHGVFGALDRELVHFVWDGLVLAATVAIRWHFRQVRNIWLTLAVAAAALHQVEHIFLFGMYLFDPATYRAGGTVFGLCAIPDGAGVQAGLLGHDGLLGTLAGRDGWLNGLLPNRINLHFVYNTVVLVPMLAAFATQSRYVYDEWLARALPRLREDLLVAATAQARPVRFAAGATIFREGDPADALYVISRGQVEVSRREGGRAEPLARLAEGQFFGEIGALGRGRRSATVTALTEVECLALGLEAVKELLGASREAAREVDAVLRRRLVQLAAIHGLAVRDEVQADDETVLKTLMIRRRVELIEARRDDRLLRELLDGA
ncbi:MAG TPA: cyclic nucleotide-binding domain-containing protein [Chloroflexaceae bacterium]|nr:cyclic nucleotide-binding domain-containing protein [Chloroflexaceae bacterium]